MIKISDTFYVDYLLKTPYNKERSEINLLDLKVITIKQLMRKSDSPYDDEDKYNKTRNILCSYMDVKHYNLNLIKPPVPEKILHPIVKEISIVSNENANKGDFTSQKCNSKNTKNNYGNSNKNNNNKIHKININDSNDINNNNDSDVLKSYKEKQISPSTADTDKSVYNNGNNILSKRNDSDLDRDLKKYK